MLRHISTYLDLREIFRSVDIENSTITQTESYKRQKKADTENSVTQPEEDGEAITEEIN